jgi:alpha-tubulin suppressor-like RCC1 family protein
MSARDVRDRIQVLLAVVLVLAGCSLDTAIPNAQLTCEPTRNECPSGYSCVANGGRSVCCKGGNCSQPTSTSGTTEDASNPDAESEGGDASVLADTAARDDGGPNDSPATSPEGGPVGVGDAPEAVDGSADVPAQPMPDGAVPDAPAVSGKATGASCNGKAECASGNCVDGVCCESSCPGQCEACGESGSPGKCVAISGKPRGFRPTCSGQGTTCGGACDGMATTACTYPGKSQECAAGSCQNGVEKSKAFCDGAGSCPAQVSTPCAPFQCGPTACDGQCSGPQSCASGSYCSGGKCVAKLAAGDMCSSGDACTTGSCVDGRCCGSSTCGSCQECKGAGGTCVSVIGRDDPDSCTGTCDSTGACKSKQGQPCGSSGCAAGTTCSPDGICCDQPCTASCMACDLPGFVGKCTAVAGGPPHGNRSSCGTGQCAGACDGRPDGQCSFPSSTCGGGPTCSPSGLIIGQGTCTAGSCVTPAPANCPGGFVCAGSACKTTCSSDLDCQPTSFCSGGTCHLDAVKIFASHGDTRTPVGHFCVILVDGSVRCWGGNGAGQLGNGAANDSSPVPVTAPTLAGTKEMGLGSHHTCAIGNDGLVRCLGSNSAGQLGGSTGNSSMSLTAVVVSGVSGATKVAGSNMGTCALLSDGTGRCWGDIVASTSSAIPLPVSGLSSATSLVGGGRHYCALLSSGSVTCWGVNFAGQLGNGTLMDSSVPVPTLNQVEGIVAIASGVLGNCELASAGFIQCWGQDAGGTVHTKPDASLGLGGATGIAYGAQHACALLSGGAVACWGDNFNCQLGNGTKDKPLTPFATVTVKGVTNATAIAAGIDGSCAILTNGSVACWGTGPELGNGSGFDVCSTGTPVTGW